MPFLNRVDRRIWWLTVSKAADRSSKIRNEDLEAALASLMPSSHYTILARFFTRRQVLINHRQMPEIGGKSVLVPTSDNRAVWIIKDAIWGNRRCVADAREIFGMLNIWSCRRFTGLLCEWVLTGFWLKNTSAMTYRPLREQDTGQLEVQGGLFFFFFFLQSEH